MGDTSAAGEAAPRVQVFNSVQHGAGVSRTLPSMESFTESLPAEEGQVLQVPSSLHSCGSAIRVSGQSRSSATWRCRQPIAQAWQVVPTASQERARSRVSKYKAVALPVEAAGASRLPGGA